MFINLRLFVCFLKIEPQTSEGPQVFRGLPQGPLFSKNEIVDFTA